MKKTRIVILFPDRRADLVQHAETVDFLDVETFDGKSGDRLVAEIAEFNPPIVVMAGFPDKFSEIIRKLRDQIHFLQLVILDGITLEHDPGVWPDLKKLGFAKWQVKPDNISEKEFTDWLDTMIHEHIGK